MILYSNMLEVGSEEVNVHLLADEASGLAMMVDAGGFDPALADLVQRHNLHVAHIALTHAHFDHVDALDRYLKLWPNATVMCAGPLPGGAARPITPGDQFPLGQWQIQVLDTAGHTPESVSYYCSQAGVCFTGDALFAGSVGGTSDDRHYRQEIENICRHILTLPDDTEILPGHGPMTTVRIERRANPFLQSGFTRT